MNKEIKRKKSKFGIFKINKHPASSKDDSIEIKNKIVTEKETVLSSTGLKNSIAHSTEKPVEIKDKKIIEKLTKETELVIKIVSEQLKPDMEISIKNHFDAMRNNLLNEIKDIRTMIEQGKILEQPHIDPAQAVPPQNMPKLSGQTNDETRQNPTPQNKTSVQQKPIIDPNIMDGILKMLPEYLKQRSQPDPVMLQIKELMMKKFVNDMGRSDTQGTALTNYLIKRLMKTDPDLFSTEDIPNTLSG